MKTLAPRGTVEDEGANEDKKEYDDEFCFNLF
jgi:hypothetical protein